MARVRKKIAELGTKHARTPDGKPVTITVTADRIKRWVETDAELRKSGVRIPVPYGHQLSALPADPLLTDSRAFFDSRYNAGESLSLEVDADGDLCSVIEAPGLEERDGKLVSVATLPDGQVVTTAIGEVSPFIAGSWTDGNGKEWRDFVAHVALTPRPVWAGQPGFVAMSAAKPLDGVYLGSAMPDDPNPKKKPKPGAKPGEPPVDDGEPESADEELVEDLTQPPPDDEGEAVPGDADDGTGLSGADPNADKVSGIVGLLAEVCGLTLPPDTNPENILETLYTALSVAKGLKANMGAQTQPTPEPTQPQAPQPMQRPGAMMSALPPVAQNIVRREFKSNRAKRLDRVTALVGRNLPVTTANQLRAEIAGVKLSLDADGEIRPHEIDARLDLLEQVLPAADDPAALLSNANPVPSPIDNPTAAEATDTTLGNDIPMSPEQAAEIKRRADAAGGYTR